MKEDIIKKFEDLGYTYSYDDGFIEYRKEKTNGLEPTLISFDIGEQSLFITRIDKKYTDVNLSLELLLAINEQCKALWRKFN